MRVHDSPATVQRLGSGDPLHAYCENKEFPDLGGQRLGINQQDSQHIMPGAAAASAKPAAAAASPFAAAAAASSAAAPFAASKPTVAALGSRIPTVAFVGVQDVAGWMARDRTGRGTLRE